jgi:TATA-box binding protein (TBP) (component of TFIID and TFIIIB)
MKGMVTVFDSGAMIGIGSRSVEDAERDLAIAYNVILSIARVYTGRRVYIIRCWGALR